MPLSMTLSMPSLSIFVNQLSSSSLLSLSLLSSFLSLPSSLFLSSVFLSSVVLSSGFVSGVSSVSLTMRLPFASYLEMATVLVPDTVLMTVVTIVFVPSSLIVDSVIMTVSPTTSVSLEVFVFSVGVSFVGTSSSLPTFVLVVSPFCHLSDKATGYHRKTFFLSCQSEV